MLYTSDAFLTGMTLPKSVACFLGGRRPSVLKIVMEALHRLGVRTVLLVKITALRN